MRSSAFHEGSVTVSFSGRAGSPHGVYSFSMNPSLCVSCFRAPLNQFRPRVQRRYQRRIVPSCELYRRALAVDYGLVRVGMAVSLGFAPRPLRCLTHDAKPSEVAAAVNAVARRELAKDIVVGLPLTASGLYGEQAEATQVFVEELVKTAPWATIYLLDERYTTQLARASLLADNVPAEKIASMLDSAAAVEIANRFFANADSGEAQPELVHKPKPRSLVGTEGNSGVELEEGAEDEGIRGDQDTIDSEQVMRESFFSWKKNAMARAIEDAQGLPKKKRRNRKRRRGSK